MGDIGRGSEAVSMRLQPWDIVASHQSYRQAQRKSGARRDVDLVGIKLARPLNERWYLTGQAYGAYDGEAGGYATGLWGAGLGWPLTQRSRIHAELLVGAGGGGGVASGGGALWQAQVGASYQLTRSGLIQLEWGRVRAPSGELNADLVNLNWVYRFARPEASH
ncbi:MAG: hypothetical protein D4R70_01045 [Betaproteobacteria bacterium]|nr:MAG: hypothetical protein D4R70_01045 [Betaproteobacteria bacterium]